MVRTLRPLPLPSQTPPSLQTPETPKTDPPKYPWSNISNSPPPIDQSPLIQLWVISQQGGHLFFEGINKLTVKALADKLESLLTAMSARAILVAVFIDGSATTRKRLNGLDSRSLSTNARTINVSPDQVAAVVAMAASRVREYMDLSDVKLDGWE